MRQQRSIYQIFAIPFLLFVIGMIGLISALVFDNIIDLLATLAVAMPIIIVFRVIFYRTGQGLLKHRDTRR